MKENYFLLIAQRAQAKHSFYNLLVVKFCCEGNVAVAFVFSGIKAT